MKLRIAAFCLVLAGLCAGAGTALADKSVGFIATAVADPGRPAADVARDADRKPAQMLRFAGIKPGETVLEMIPGGGYFTRLLSKAVGPTGHVYAAAPPPTSADAEPAAAKIAADPAYANVTVIAATQAAMMALPPVDVVWTSQNYHDLHLSRLHLDVPGLDKVWLSVLKPGGELMIIDHVALTGSPVTETADKLHRIDPAAVRAEVEGAGFKFDGESAALRNPADPHTVIVFDPSIRGHTDQFAYRFKKP
jgi:predicted methyltransferase